MKKILFSFTLFLTLALLFSALIIPSSATSAPEMAIDASKNAKGIYLYSYDADRVLFSQGVDLTLAPASTSKMMAGVLVCERYYDMLDKTVTVTDKMLVGHQGTSMGIKSGMSLTVRELLYGTICGGNNDAALVLAYACSGDISSFVDEMNKYVRLLDMRNTRYTNPTGLDSNDARTTIDDVAKLARKAAESKIYSEISSAHSYEIERYSLTIYNRNALISQFSAQGYVNKYATGLISGSTDEGGYVLAATAEKNDMQLLCVVMGATSRNDRIYSYEIADDLFDTAFNKYSFTKIAKGGSSFDAIPVNLALTDKNGAEVSCVIAEDIYALLPDNVTPSMLTYKSILHSEVLVAPVEQNEVVGSLVVYYGDTFITQVPLVAQNSVEPNILLLMLYNVKNFFLGRVFWITVCLAIPAVMIYLHVSKRFRRKTVSTVKFKKFY